MPLTAVEPRRLYRQIADQIDGLIAAGEFPPGSRLPPERELAGKLGVSRASVREAVICLELAGSVEVRVGTGIFVCRRDASRALSARRADAAVDEGPGPFELLAARALIEGEIAALAARSIKAPQIARLRELIARMRAEAENCVERDDADRSFHLTIAEATGNGALVLTVASLWDQRRGELWTKTEQHFHTPALREKTIADHLTIVDALAARDADGAREAMRRHLSRVAHEFQRRIDDAPRVRRAAAKLAERTGGRAPRST